MTQGDTYNIMLVDDDRFLLDMYSMKFTKAGHAVNACVSAEEALEALRGGYKPDAIVFDLVMPKKGGEDLLREVHAIEAAAGAPVLIALTNQSTDEERKRVEELGVHEYIIKANMIPSEVVQKVFETIEAKRRSGSHPVKKK